MIYSTFIYLAIATLLAQIAQACTLPPTTECLIQSSQFTILGTVTKTNRYSDLAPDASPENFNATIEVLCVYSTFFDASKTYRTLRSRQSVTVVNFGYPKPGCPSDFPGPRAEPNMTAMWFLYVWSTPMDGDVYYSLHERCVGSVDASPENLQIMSNILAQNPKTSVLDGIEGQCKLPPPSIPAVAPTSANSVGTIQGPAQPSAAAKATTIPSAATSQFASFLLCSIALMSLALVFWSL
ncbi:hypothetical protein HDU76_000235 [Blyttiomyces sp. JEL0837]|nr:hypothetical protein HDU76_000235 [Blyttiomyces sp. JEL0837]